MDWLSLIIGAIVGIPVGFVSNVVYAYFQAKRQKAEARRKYEAIVGEYVAYVLPGKFDEIDYNKPEGACQVWYEKENVLQLRYKELNHDNVWGATIWMETPFTGSMAWRYHRLSGREPPREHRFGFKRCLVVEKPGRDGKPRTYVYLEGEPPFGKEVLEKKA